MDRHSLDGIQPSLAAEHSEEMIKGVKAVFAAVVQHPDEWQQLLEDCRGINVRYLPMISIHDMQKQLWDLNVFHGFQSFSSDRLKQYFQRMGVRIGLAGEEVQCWLDSSWKDPTSELALPMAQCWLSGCQSVFTRELGLDILRVRCFGDVKDIMGGDSYFAQDNVAKAIALAHHLSSDSKTCETYINSLCIMLQQWLEEQLVPGASLPEELRKIPD